MKKFIYTLILLLGQLFVVFGQSAENKPRTIDKSKLSIHDNMRDNNPVIRNRHDDRIDRFERRKERLERNRIDNRRDRIENRRENRDRDFDRRQREAARDRVKNRRDR